MEGLTVYVDLLFFVGFLIDGALLWVTARLSGRRLRRWRWAAASALAALSGVFFVVYGTSLPVRLCILLSAAPVCALAFGFRGWRVLGKDLLVYGAVNGCFAALLFLAASLPGASRLLVTSDGELFCRVTLPALLIFTALICGGMLWAGRFFRRRPAKERICVCRIDLFGRSAQVLCYVDSGNFLRDALSGLPVAVVEFSAIRSLLPHMLSPEELMTARFGENLQNRFRLVPYHGVGGSSGVLSAFRPDGFTVNGTKKEAIVAISPGSLEEHGRYQGIIGSILADEASETPPRPGGRPERKGKNVAWKRV